MNVFPEIFFDRLMFESSTSAVIYYLVTKENGSQSPLPEKQTYPHALFPQNMDAKFLPRSSWSLSPGQNLHSIRISSRNVLITLTSSKNGAF